MFLPLRKKQNLKQDILINVILLTSSLEFSQGSHGPATLAAAMVICVLWCYDSLLSMCAILSPVVLSC